MQSFSFAGSLAGPLLAGIAYDPTIRGILTVVVGVVVLMGSVYLLLATNTGNRLGFLLALTGLFGWMVIMGIIWWIYGIGMLGQAASWKVVEYNADDPAAAVTGKVRDLADLSSLPQRDGEVDYPLVRALEAADPLVLAKFLASDEERIAEFDAETREVLEASLEDEPTPEQVDAVAELVPQIIEDRGWTLPDELPGEWTLLAPSNPARGEAEATVSANLPECDTCNFGITEPSQYLVLTAFQVGGKDRLEEGASMVDRVKLWVEHTVQIRHPKHYAVVQVRKVVEQTAEPGQAPPLPVADEDEPVISVVMIRDIGDRRFPSAVITVVSAIIFGFLCYVLHRRERILEENLAHAAEVGAGSR